MNKDDRKFFSSHCCYGIDNQNQTQAKIEMKSAHQQINPNHAQNIYSTPNTNKHISFVNFIRQRKTKIIWNQLNKRAETQLFINFKNKCRKATKKLKSKPTLVQIDGEMVFLDARGRLPMLVS